MRVKTKQTTLKQTMVVVISVFLLTCLSVWCLYIYFNTNPSIPLIDGNLIIKSSTEQKNYSIAIKDISNANEVYNKEILITAPNEKNNYIMRAKVEKKTKEGLSTVDVNIQPNWLMAEDGYFYYTNFVAENLKIPFASGTLIIYH